MLIEMESYLLIQSQRQLSSRYHQYDANIYIYIFLNILMGHKTINIIIT